MIAESGACLGEVRRAGVLDLADGLEHGDPVIMVERGAACHHLKDQHPGCPPAPSLHLIIMQYSMLHCRCSGSSRSSLQTAAVLHSKASHPCCKGVYTGVTTLYCSTGQNRMAGPCYCYIGLNMASLDCQQDGPSFLGFLGTKRKLPRRNRVLRRNMVVRRNRVLTRDRILTSPQLGCDRTV